MLKMLTEENCGGNMNATEWINGRSEKTKLSMTIVRTFRTNKAYRRKFGLTLAVFWSYVTLVSCFSKS
jgi:hypothetical protein